MIDFHTHILPDIDDGAESIEDSVKMIQMLCEQGVKKILLTPHFYAYVSSVESFLEKRKRSLEKLLKALETEKPDVDIYIGGEVLFFEELWRISELKSLCISGTEYILLEMPFSSWDRSMVENVLNLCNKGVVPIIAHFDRYLKYKGNLSKIDELVSSGVLLQMNSGYLNRFFTRGKAIKYIKRGMVFALGSDCHNIYDRKPELGSAEEILKKKLRRSQYRRFVSEQERFFKKADKVYPSK